MMHLTNIADLLGGSCTQEARITGVCTDSRAIKPGQLFFALQGKHFDGHHFLEEVEAKGAMAVVCSRANKALSIPQFVVEEPLKALALLAREHRQSIHCPVIALTGSNGKTTVKEMIASILPKPSHATPGNWNNHIGVPLSIFELKESHRYAVFELGANHKGEIAYTAAMVQPQVALINNIATAHVGEFGSIEGVAQAKGEIYEALQPGRVAILNEDDDYAHFWDNSLHNKRLLRFSLSKSSADIYAEEVEYDENDLAQFKLCLPTGKTEIRLQVPGKHNVCNALAAASCCYAIDIHLQDIAQGLNQFYGVPGRMTFLAGKKDALIIDDTYNANLRSVLAALAVLSKRKGCRIFVFGDMGELGEWTHKHHEEVGLAARKLGIDYLFTCGVHSLNTSKAFGAHAKHYDNHDKLAQDLLNKLNADTTVLLKGSRSSRMEIIAHQLVKEVNTVV